MYLCKEDGNHCSSILLTSIKEAADSSRVFPLKGCLTGPKPQQTIIIMSGEIYFTLGTTNGKTLICICPEDCNLTNHLLYMNKHLKTENSSRRIRFCKNILKEFKEMGCEL